MKGTEPCTVIQKAAKQRQQQRGIKVTLDTFTCTRVVSRVGAREGWPTRHIQEPKSKKDKTKDDTTRASACCFSPSICIPGLALRAVVRYRAPPRALIYLGAASPSAILRLGKVSIAPEHDRSIKIIQNQPRGPGQPFLGPQQRGWSPNYHTQWPNPARSEAPSAETRRGRVSRTHTCMKEPRAILVRPRLYPPKPQHKQGSPRLHNLPRLRLHASGGVGGPQGAQGFRTAGGFGVSG